MDARHQAAFQRRRKNLIRRARKAAARANSWRGFRVGCAVLAWNGKKYQSFVGANVKPVDGGSKFCSEWQAIGTARAEGFHLIVAVVVSGKPQMDQRSGFEPPTLHPCEACRFLMRNISEILDDTIILTVCNSEGPEEEMSFLELWELHRYHEKQRSSQEETDRAAREWARQDREQSD